MRVGDGRGREGRGGEGDGIGKEREKREEGRAAGEWTGYHACFLFQPWHVSILFFVDNVEHWWFIV